MSFELSSLANTKIRIIYSPESKPHLICFLQEIIDTSESLSSILISFYRIHSTAGPSGQTILKLCIFTEPTGVTQEGILLVVVDSSALVALNTEYINGVSAGASHTEYGTSVWNVGHHMIIALRNMIWGRGGEYLPEPVCFKSFDSSLNSLDQGLKLNFRFNL